MTIASYSELLTEVDAWMDRSDLSARIPTFIKLFEARVNRILRLPAMESTSTTTLVADQTEYALPDDFLSARTVFLDSDPDRVLVAMAPANLRAAYPFSSAGIPGAYAIEGGNIILAPPPTDADELTLVYYQSIPALTETDTTNWLLTAHPDAYLYGTLAMASVYLKDDERAGLWKSAWDECLGEIVKHGNKQRTPASPLQMRSAVSE